MTDDLLYRLQVDARECWREAVAEIKGLRIERDALAERADAAEHDLTRTYESLQGEMRGRLEAEARADALHKALRERAIRTVSVVPYGYRTHVLRQHCDLCANEWVRGEESEYHAEGCLAAPSAPKEQQQQTTGNLTE